MENRLPITLTSKQSEVHVQKRGNTNIIDVKLGNRSNPASNSSESARASGSLLLLDNYDTRDGYNANFVSSSYQDGQHPNFYNLRKASPSSSIGSGSSPRASTASTALPDHLLPSPSANSVGSTGESKPPSLRTSLTNISSLINERFPAPRMTQRSNAPPGQSLLHAGAVSIPVLHQQTTHMGNDSPIPPPPPYNPPKLGSSEQVLVNNMSIRAGSPMRQSPQLTGNALSSGGRLKGLVYDVVPPRRDGPTEAERKLAELTQQLENDMGITKNASAAAVRSRSNASSSSGSSYSAQLRMFDAPPPYPGVRHQTQARMLPHLQQLHCAVPPGSPSPVAMTPPPPAAPPASLPPHHLANLQSRGHSSLTPTYQIATATVPTSATAFPIHMMPANATTSPAASMIERKLEAMTLNIEKGWEQQAQAGDYLGKTHNTCNFISHAITWLLHDFTR